MAKDTFYFSHDYDSRQDQKIQKLIYKHGWSGYGLYWALIEMLYSNDGYLDYECERIAFELRTESELISSVINDFELFKIKDNAFFSKSVLHRLEKRKGKSITAKKSAEARWNKERQKDANALQTQSEGNAIKERKVKESKVKDNIFKIPEIEEVKEYCKERKNSVDANKFIDFYSAKGWMIGKNKMKDWRAAVRTWEGKTENKNLYPGYKDQSNFE